MSDAEIRALTQDDGTTVAQQDTAADLANQWYLNYLRDVRAGDQVVLRDTKTNHTMGFIVTLRTDHTLLCGPITIDAETGRGVNYPEITLEAPNPA